MTPVVLGFKRHSASTKPVSANVRYVRQHDPSDALVCATLERSFKSEQWPQSTPPDPAVLQERALALARAEQMAYPGGTQVDTARAYLDQARRRAITSRWLAADACGAFVGTASLAPVRRRPEQAALFVYVIPAARNRGVGRALIVAATRHARQQGVCALQCTTQSHMTAGVALVRRMRGRSESAIRRIDRLTCDTSWVDSTVNAASGDALNGLSVEAVIADELTEQHRFEIAVLQNIVSRTYGIGAGSAQDADMAARRRFRVAGELGLEYWLLCAAVNGGPYVGYSGYLWDPDEPDALAHTGLCVAPEHRGSTLALHLLSHCRQIERARPSVRRIRLTRPYKRQDGAPPAFSGGRGIISQHVETRWLIDLNTVEECVSGAPPG